MGTKEIVVVIDSQNLYRGTNWKIDYRKLRLWFTNKYKITRSIMFFGYVESQTGLYQHIKQCGFEIVFRPVEKTEQYIKGNVDVDIAVWVVDHKHEYDECYLVTSDGDFYTLVDWLQKQNSFAGIFSPHQRTCSHLLQTIAGPQIRFLDDSRNNLEIK